MSKLYVIMGKSASGKDTIYRELMEKKGQLMKAITYTTRPIRAGETHGKEYFFVNQDEMYELEEAGKVIECREYDTVHGPWFYFTVDDGQFDFQEHDYVMINTLEGYVKLRDYFGEEFVEPIYVQIDDFVRMERALSREREQEIPCVAEVCRRFLADEQDFSRDKLVQAEVNDSVENDSVSRAVAEICGKYGF